MRIILFLIISFTFQLSYTQEAGFAGSKGGKVTLNNIKKCKKIYVKGRPDWTIVSWSCILLEGSKMTQYVGTNEFLTEKVLESFRGQHKNSCFSIQSIVAQDPEGNNFNLGQLYLCVF
jgi:hypothetical protein